MQGTVRDLLVSVSMVVTVAACSSHGERGVAVQSADPVAVRTTVAAMEQLPRVTTATGSIEPWTRVSPGTKILGRLEEVGVREGDRVQRGQILARLDDADLSAAVEQVQAAVRMAEANLENASSQHRRMVLLHERGSVTDKSLEDAVAAYRVAQAGLEKARANLSAAEVTLSYAVIRSPIAGWVVKKMAESGDMITPGTPLLTIEDLSRIKVTIHVPETDVVGLREGSPAQVRVDVLEEEFDAAVDLVVPAGDPASRTFRVQVILENPDGRMRSGMFARARFLRGQREALVIPKEAVVRRGGLDGTFVIGDDGMARLHWLKLGRAEGDVVEILSGVEAGARLVVSPPPELADGSRVEAR
jgi:RND family efflux transporter MFP subunit